MHVELLGQPYAEEPSLADRLNEAISSDSFQEIYVAAAWVRDSGLSMLGAALQTFRDRGGYATIVTGVSLDGATRQGLSAALQLFDEAYVFHQSGRTFHPKVYYLGSDQESRLFVGSSNGTRGGLQLNWEASVDIRLESARREDRNLDASVRAYFDRLISDTAVCRQLSNDLIDELMNDPGLNIADEDRRHPVLPTGVVSSLQSFGRSAHAINVGGTVRNVSPAKNASRAFPTLGGLPEVLFRWSKKLPLADSQRLRESNPTGTVTLAQADARKSIDQSTWFRDVLFATEDWVTSDGGKYSVAWVTFFTTIHGRNLGMQRLQIRHTPHFESGQANRKGSFHWGHLTDETRRSDLTGDIFTIERLSDGLFTLTISKERRGHVIV